MKRFENKEKADHKISHSAADHKHPELKTDMPLSEKDEVKKAETRTRKALKDHL